MPRRKKKQGLDYKDHTPMLRNIPDYFYSALAGELVSVFSPTIFDKDEDGLMGLDLCTGTGGWNAALEMTCKKLDLMWLYSYYLTLTWYDSDRFDSDIYELLLSKFVNLDTHDNKYYQYLIGYKDKED